MGRAWAVIGARVQDIDPDAAATLQRDVGAQLMRMRYESSGGCFFAELEGRMAPLITQHDFVNCRYAELSALFLDDQGFPRPDVSLERGCRVVWQKPNRQFVLYTNDKERLKPLESNHVVSLYGRFYVSRENGVLRLIPNEPNAEDLVTGQRCWLEAENYPAIYFDGEQPYCDRKAWMNHYFLVGNILYGYQVIQDRFGACIGGRIVPLDDGVHCHNNAMPLIFKDGERILTFDRPNARDSDGNWYCFDPVSGEICALVKSDWYGSRGWIIDRTRTNIWDMPASVNLLGEDLERTEWRFRERQRDSTLSVPTYHSDTEYTHTPPQQKEILPFEIQDALNILGFRSLPTPAELRRTWRSRWQTLHPDTHEDGTEFIRLRTAYDRLMRYLEKDIVTPDFETTPRLLTVSDTSEK